MILAENFKLKESLLFLLSMRETLCILVNESKIPYKKELKSFIINEASDYQIISLIVDGELPLSESQHFNELVLFERIRLEVKENKNLICEMFGVDVFDDITKKIDSIGPKFSTRKSLLEVEDDNPYSIQNMLKNAGKNPVKPSKYPIDPKTQKFLDVGQKAVDKYYAKQDLPKLKPKYDISSPEVIDKVRSIPKAITKSIPTKSVPTKAISKVVNKPPITVPKTDVKKVVNLRANIDKAFNDLKQQAQSGSQAATSFVKAHPGVIAGVLLAVLAIYVTSKLYKRFYSKAAKSCSSYKGQKKTICMKKFQLTGYKAQLIDLKNAATKCGFTKNPEKCAKIIRNKMDKINKKISKAV
jgi:hypothetical protein